MRKDILVLIFVLAFAASGLLSQASLSASDYLFGSVNSVDEKIKDRFQRPNVVIIGVDRLRYRNMPCYGYERNTTYHMCQLGEEGRSFRKAYAQGTWTPPSVASMITSRYPRVHGVNQLNGRLNSSERTLAEVFKKEGYDTAAFVGNEGEDKNGALNKGLNFDQGFDVYGEKGMMLEDNVPAAIDWMNSTSSKEPFLLYVQGYEPHRYSPKSSYLDHPGRNGTYRKFVDQNYSGVFHNETILKTYGSPVVAIRWNKSTGYYISARGEKDIDIEKSDVEHVRDHYDVEVKSADQQVGRMISYLKRKGEYDNSIIVLMSSHGENWNPNYIMDGNKRVFYHGMMRESVLKVPLIIKKPDGDYGISEDKIIGLVDLMPTLLDWTGIEPSKGLNDRMQGESFSKISDKEQNFEYAYSELGHRESVWYGDWKLVKNPLKLSQNYALYRTNTRNSDPDNSTVENGKIMQLLREKLRTHRVRVFQESGG